MMEHQLSVKMTLDEYDYVERTAEKIGISKGEVVRRLIGFSMKYDK